MIQTYTKNVLNVQTYKRTNVRFSTHRDKFEKKISVLTFFHVENTALFSLCHRIFVPLPSQSGEQRLTSIRQAPHQRRAGTSVPVSRHLIDGEQAAGQRTADKAPIEANV